MKKLIPILLVSLIFLNTFGFNMILGYLIYKCKIDFSKENVLNYEKVTILKILPSQKNKLQWIDNDEFRFDEKLYDVVKKVNKCDTLFVYCINDKQEDKLFEILFKVDNNSSNQSEASYVQKNIVKNYIVWDKNLKFIYPGKNRIFVNAFFNYNSPVEKINPPPPKSFAFFLLEKI